MMGSKQADEVLKELARVGAVGGSRKTPVSPEASVTEVVIERGPPSTRLRDQRGAEVVQALDDALRYLDAVLTAVAGLRESLVHVRDVWCPLIEVEEGLEEAQDGPEEVRSAPEALAKVLPPSPASPARPGAPAGQDYERARLAALRKIRGEDVDVRPGESEDDIPFVGQVRALPVGQESQEVSLGTVGTIKPSFPGGQ